jgi:hypothetical protein
MNSAVRDERFSLAGFTHSDICGSMLACSSPQLFAAGHVLLRCLVPRHPPRALHNFFLQTLACVYYLDSLLFTDALVKDRTKNPSRDGRVEHTGLEPVTSGLQSPRSPS